MRRESRSRAQGIPGIRALPRATRRIAATFAPRTLALVFLWAGPGRRRLYTPPKSLDIRSVLAGPGRSGAIPDVPGLVRSEICFKHAHRASVLSHLRHPHHFSTPKGTGKVFCLFAANGLRHVFLFSFGSSRRSSILGLKRLRSAQDLPKRWGTMRPTLLDGSWGRSRSFGFRP